MFIAGVEICNPRQSILKALNILFSITLLRPTDDISLALEMEQQQQALLS